MYALLIDHLILHFWINPLVNQIMEIESEIVKSLVNYVNDRPDVKQAFENAFATAAATGILAKYNISTLDQYFAFYDETTRWVPKENVGGTEIYERLCLFYFVIDQSPIFQYQTPVNPAGGWTWLSQWLVNYAQEVGKFMDTTQSITAETLQTFYDSPAYHMQDYPKPDAGWNTFNEFFARHIDLTRRPVDGEGDPKVIDNPAESAFGGSWPIDEFSETDFAVKGIPWNISQLLENTIYADRFKGGKFMHAFLNTTDYHRQHAPVSGKIVEARVIPGVCYLEVTVQNNLRGQPRLIPRRHLAQPPRLRTINPDGSTRHVQLPEDSNMQMPTSGIVAPDSPGYQFMQARGLIVIDSPELGLVGVLPIGMAQVSSVVLSVKVGDTVNKGDEISYFQMGGSDIVMIFEKKANVTFPDPTDPPTHYLVRSKLAEANPIAWSSFLRLLPIQWQFISFS